MPNDGLLYQIRQRIDYERLFSEFCRLHGSGPERSARCVFHEDHNPSMSINVVEGLYRCHNPECGAQGDFIDFFMRVRDLRFSEAVAELARRVGLEYERDPGRGDSGVIDEAIVEAAHHRLINTPEFLRFLSERRGLTLETVRQWKLGHDGQRYYIPIRDELGRVVNIRRYKPDARQSHDKMISWRTGYGQARIWPFDSIERAISERSVLYLFEGEMDALLAIQHGLCAVTATGGAGTWRDTWTPLFQGRDVVICYDNDGPGHTGALQVASKIHGVAERVRIVHPPLSEPRGADFTDYIVGHGHTIEDFLALVESAPTHHAPVEPPEAEPSDADREPTMLHLSQASLAEYYNAPVRFAVMVSGKTMAPYLVPRQVRASCSMPGQPMCERCPVGSAAGSLRHDLSFGSNEVLQFCNVPDAHMQKLLKSKIGIPSRCSYVDLEVTDSMNIEEVQLIPEVARSDEEAPYVTRLAYFIGHGLQANRSYLMTGVTVPDPKRQLATHLIHSAIPAQSNIDAFRLTDDVIERLSIFQPAGNRVEDLWDKVNDIYEDIEAHTRIYQRRDLMIAVDLTFHSVLSFDLQGERLVRGWVETLIIGDSRTGKTTIVSRMSDYYGAGEICSGENTSIAGLVGGLHQVGTSWALQWGRVPLNDRRLLIIDEAGNLPPEHIGRLSSMRSSGIAEIVKVHTERTNARTRQIWISNPRMPKPLSSYSQGVLAVKELIGAPEDIARFDLVATAASDDVSLDVINAQRTRAEPERYTADLCHQRVMWAWSRTADQVEFTAEAEARLLLRATQQGEKYKYATDVPLVEPNEQRVVLARLAVAAAAMFFSASDDGERIIVRPEHVEFVAEYLERAYSKPSLAFAEYAEMQRRRYELTDTAEIERIVFRVPGAIHALMEQERFIQRDLQEILDYDDREDLRIALTKLRKLGFLARQGSAYYVKTPAAIRWLRRQIEAERSAEMYGDEPPF